MRPGQIGHLWPDHRYLVHLLNWPCGNTATDCYLAEVVSVNEAYVIKNCELFG